MAKVFMAPEKTPWSGNFTLFLAGSIDMGKAVDWQTQVATALDDLEVDIYNPRRPDWDSTWEQKIENEQFREQVEWELKHQEIADIVCFCFDPNGQAPITLLELGLFHNKNVIVCCPPGFWRKGNVDVVCAYYGLPLVEKIEDMIEWLRARLQNDQYF